MNSRQIIKRSNERMVTVDLESDLLQNRILFITGVIDDETASTYQAELIYLANQITGDKSKSPIKIYINSPGGELYSTFGLYDVIQKLIEQGYIIQTKVIGLAASAAAFILLSGSKGHRSATPHSRIMIHQPSSGTYGTVTDMKIDLEESLAMKEEFINIINKHCEHDLSDLIERDKWLSPVAAKELGLIDIIR